MTTITYTETLVQKLLDCDSSNHEIDSYADNTFRKIFIEDPLLPRNGTGLIEYLDEKFSEEITIKTEDPVYIKFKAITRLAFRCMDFLAETGKIPHSKFIPELHCQSYLINAFVMKKLPGCRYKYAEMNKTTARGHILEISNDANTYQLFSSLQSLTSYIQQINCQKNNLDTIKIIFPDISVIPNFSPREKPNLSQLPPTSFPFPQ